MRERHCWILVACLLGGCLATPAGSKYSTAAEKNAAVTHAILVAGGPWYPLGWKMFEWLKEAGYTKIDAVDAMTLQQGARLVAWEFIQQRARLSGNQSTLLCFTRGG